MFRLVPFSFLLLIALALPKLSADDAVQQLATARTHWLHGRYDEAIEAFQVLLEHNEVGAAASIGLSRCYEAIGKWDEAAGVIAKAIEKSPTEADLQARGGEIALLRGELDRARAACKQALRQNPDHLRARWILVRLDAATGELDSLRSGCEWFVQLYNRKELKDPESLVLIGQAAAEHAARTMRGREQSQQLSTVLNKLFDAATEEDHDYWPAIYLAGKLFLEKYRKGDALKDLQRALAINPNAAEVHVALGISDLNDYEIESGHVHADRALAINPNLPAARQLKADLFMAREQYAEAIEQLEQARTVNPVDEETASRIAACQWLTRQTSEFDRICAEVRARNPRPATFYSRLAERLEDHRRFDLAEQAFKQAIEADPDQSGPRAGLGLLYMRTGQEAEATVTLDNAFAMDPFNARLKNMLEVLDQLKGYDTIETDHFRVKVDGKLDGMLGRYAAKYLEDVYVELTERFGFHPQDRIQIEIFNKGRGESAHRWFSARTVGLPWIGTVGACTGKVVAMTSPRGVEQPFNWARVLKHEVSHVITLQQTNFNIPHWYTEALAVEAEEYPRPQVWNQLLAQRVPAGTLFTLDNINLAFARPKTQLDWQMAYCQSELYAEYMQQRFGDDSRSRLLDAYREGLTTAAAIDSVFGVSVADFESGYLEHIRKVAQGLHTGPAEPPMTRAELEQAVVSQPTNPDVAARLAGEYLKLRNYPKVRELALKATQLKEHHPLGSFMLARLHTLVGESDRAREVLEPAVDRDNPDPRVLEMLANLFTQAKEYDKANSLYELGHKCFPTDSKWIAGVARIALIKDNRDGLREALEQLCLVEADDVSPRRKLARMAVEDKDWNRAARFAWMTLHIDVTDLDAHAILAEALAGQEKWSQAADEYRSILDIRPEDQSIAMKLAKSLQAAGSRDAAVDVLKQLLAKDPKNSEARELLDELMR